MDKDFDYYKKLIEEDQLPDSFNQWLMKGKFSYTLAHFAAEKGILPPDWTDKTEDWLVENKYRITIAHEAALKNILPTNWTDKTEDWLVKDRWGNTIAHEAAYSGFLPMDWTDDPKDWLIKNKWKDTIGLYFCHHKEHYNNPKTLEEYCQNMIDHIYPIVEKEKITSWYVNDVNNFLELFIDSIQKQSEDDWMKTSDDYSGFLIDYIESVIDYIQHNLRFDDDIRGDDLILVNQIKKNIEQTSQLIKDEKIKIKEHLFKHHESKNQSVIKEKEPDFSETL